ncbi:hypothetical protein N7456_000582 [Penicillium angulare]|uniref:Uncharacterized protein n=1 Tax=Penicillium angulare TaxID=116970 RepID=A0A9W9GCA6_9EURO|nr:hypothetical protein N7456_000582 [Penicillium angulare]
MITISDLLPAQVSVAVDDYGVAKCEPGTHPASSWAFLLNYIRRLHISALFHSFSWDTEYGTTLPCYDCLYHASHAYCSTVLENPYEQSADKSSVSEIIESCTFVGQDDSMNYPCLRVCHSCPKCPIRCCRLHYNILPEESDIILSAIIASDLDSVLPECQRFESIQRLIERHKLLVAEEMHIKHIEFSMIVFKGELRRVF